MENNFKIELQHYSIQLGNLKFNGKEKGNKLCTFIEKNSFHFFYKKLSLFYAFKSLIEGVEI